METQDERNKKMRKLFELNDFLRVIDRDVNGNPIIIGNPAFSTLNSTRIAENENDFEDIYNRELKTVGSDIINISSYITKCKKRVNDMVEVYEKICEEGNHKEDDKLLDTAVSYVIFLERKISLQQNLDVSLTVPTPENKQKTNKSLMFKGQKLNIKDRYRILNTVLNFDKTVHPLNIGELEKYQLLAYILGIDKDNARKLMNGKHDAKDTDLTAYFNEIGLNK